MAYSDTSVSYTPVSTYGTPGYINMPSGAVLPDGQIRSTLSFFDNTQFYSFNFQISPRLFGTFRYTIIDGFDTAGDRFDRSFDIGYLLSEETKTFPSVVIGLRDFGGTGIYASEYIAATKHFQNRRLSLTGGLGWGRLATHGGFSNPLGLLGSHFDKTRDISVAPIEDAGKISFGDWFTGDAAFFAGLSYRLSDRLSFKMEYSSDAQVLEQKRLGFEHKTPINAALTYHFKNGGELTGYILHGSTFGLQASFATDPFRSRVPGGMEKAPPAILPRSSRAHLTWSDIDTVQASLSKSLSTQGLRLEGISTQGDTTIIRVRNLRYPAEAQALGRAFRVAANTLPITVETIRVELTALGVPTTRVTLRRQDLEELEHDLEASWKSFARARIEDAAGSDIIPTQGIYPKLDWSLTPYLEPSFFDPDNPVRADLGLHASASYDLGNGLIFSGSVRKPLVGNLNEVTRKSNSVLPHVRTDAGAYHKQSDLQIRHLTAEYFFRPGRNLFGRLSAGYLEMMYGGVSAELLWKPVDSRLALGAEINYARQRSFDQLFGFQDYDIVTGHASAYYDFGSGYQGQMDVGRYLAGDWGATFSLDREFANGFSFGAFFSLTNVSFDDFGEGAFDKGIRFNIPIDWLTGLPKKGGYGAVIRPVQRDGGARLNVRNRLYDAIRSGHLNKLNERWGRFWR